MSKLRVTVAELPDEGGRWDELVAHVAKTDPDWVVLPEMPFTPWVASTECFQQSRWDDAAAAHANAEGSLLPAMGRAAVFYTKPINDCGRRYNAACVFAAGQVREIHRKVFLPNEEPVWEANWYHRGEGFRAASVRGVSVGALICTEIWFFDKARAYGKDGVAALLTPRKTDGSTTDRWLVAGQAAAISAGAYSLSANSRSGAGGHGFGGVSWIIDPSGQILARTNEEVPFVTAEIDVAVADAAKHTYPRNIPD